MKKSLVIIFILLVLALGAWFYFVQIYPRNSQQPDPENGEHDAVEEINFSKSGNLIRNNPGLRPNTWYLLYEQPGAAALSVILTFDDKSECYIGQSREMCGLASFQDGNGNAASVDGVSQSNGSVLVRKLVIPEQGQQNQQMRDVLLYYYNPNTDKDASGNTMCSRNGLAGVSRKMPETITPIQDAINLLLQGNLTEGEKKAGITTEFPLPGLELTGANLKNGVLTLEFSDPNGKTGGGACRAGILWFQIEATAKQFPEVKVVRFIPETLFQP